MSHEVLETALVSVIEAMLQRQNGAHKNIDLRRQLLFLQVEP